MKLNLLLVLGIILLLTGCTEEMPSAELNSKGVVEETKENTVIPSSTIENTVEENKQPKPLTKVEHEYLDVFSKSLDFMSNESDTISTLLEEADSNPSIIYDEQWNYHLNDAFTRITIFTNLLQEMKDTNNVPERFTELHYYHYESFNFMRIAGEKIIDAVANGYDEEILKEGEEYISSSYSMAENRSEELERITKEVKGQK